MSKLSDPIKIGEFQLRNRIIMAPLTRCRADERRIPGALAREYYRQRASAGMIITEATSVAPMGVGYPNTPGIWSDEQVDGWRKITEAVHAANGTILLQLWHVGRISDPVYLDGHQPVAPSAIRPKGHVSLIRPKREFVIPRQLATEELPEIVDAFKRGAENARKAGFDGVEIHGANGYLLDQFLQSSTNTRTDSYGGSLENRARFMLEVTDAVLTVWPAGRVGMHLAPRADSHDMGDEHRADTFSYVAKELGKRKLAFLCAREYAAADSLASRLKRDFGGIYIANEKFDQNLAEQWLAENRADAVAFGTLFIANPDLPERFAQRAPLNEVRPELFYAPGPEGYIDYPFLK